MFHGTRGAAGRLSCAVRSGVVALAGRRGVPTIQATLTDLTSSTERMISYRHQEHLWQTADGAYHLVFNRGSLSSVPGLTLYSSYDGGSTWSFRLAFADTDDDSTADGVLAGDDLSIVYRTAAGNTGFVQLRYDATLRAWAQVASETAYASTQYEAVNPALAIDSRGTVWCSLVARDRVSNDVNIRMLSRAGGGNVWTDTGLIFGPADHRSIERSARPVALPGGLGMVYAVREAGPS